MAMLVSPPFTHARPTSDAVTPLQPFADQVRELERDLDFYGQPLSAQDQAGIDAAFADTDPRVAVSRIEKILDKYDLAEVSINPESRVDAKRSLASREFALGVEALERFVRKEPLRRTHECVFGVLALESEPIDPRL